MGPRRAARGLRGGGRGGKRRGLAEWLAFRIRFAFVPAAESGKRYATLDERCRACRPCGGRERECVGEDDLKVIRKKTGRPCPRVELDPALRTEARIMQVMFHERGGPFAVDLLHGLVPPNERAAVIMRIMAADNDPIVERARKIARARDAEAPRA